MKRREISRLHACILKWLQHSGAPGVALSNSSLKLTVRPRFSRRPSRLPRLEFARRRATCTGIIGCAASGAPLDAGRHPAARNLTSRRWADWLPSSGFVDFEIDLKQVDMDFRRPRYNRIMTRAAV